MFHVTLPVLVEACPVVLGSPVARVSGALSAINNITMHNESAKLTQNTHAVFVVNSMVMATFFGAGYSTFRADTANSVFGQFKGHNSGVPGGGML